MRVNKAKFIRKYLKFYKVVFRIESPYNVRLFERFEDFVIMNSDDFGW